MKLLHVCPTLDPQAGGTVTAIRHLSEVSPTDQDILCLDASDAPWLKESISRCIGLGHKGGKYSYSPPLIPYLVSHAQQYDSVVVHGTWQYHGLGVWQALRKSSTPYFIFPHGMLDPWFRRTYPLKHLKKLVYWHAREKFILRDAAGVLFTSKEEQYGAHASFNFPLCREFVVSLGIKDPNPDGLKKIDRSEPRLLFLGRLDLKKGCDLLLQAFAGVMKGTPWKLVMGGPDSSGWKDSLQSLANRLNIASQVEWPGMLQGEEKWEALRSAQALILPSHQENFGLVVVESLACGTPVLISQQVNIWREVVEADAGFAEPDSLSGTIKLLEKWLHLDLNQKLTMNHAARTCFQRHFEIQKAFDSLRCLIQNQLDQEGIFSCK